MNARDDAEVVQMTIAQLRSLARHAASATGDGIFDDTYINEQADYTLELFLQRKLQDAS